MRQRDDVIFFRLAPNTVQTAASRRFVPGLSNPVLLPVDQLVLEPGAAGGQGMGREISLVHPVGQVQELRHAGVDVKKLTILF